MSSAAEAPRPKKRRLLLGSLTVVLIAAIAVCVVEGPLWAEVSYAANETFPDEREWGDKYVRVDVDRNLKQYTPRHLAYLLHSPSERWRGVALLGLRAHPEKDPMLWEGIPADIVKTAVGASNTGLRKLCLHAIQSVPQFSPADAKSIVETLSGHEIPQTQEMIDQVATRSQKEGSPIEPKLTEWLTGPSAARKRVAFEILIQQYPGADAACAAQIRTVFNDGGDDRKPWALLHQLVDRHAPAGESLLEGSEEDRRLLWTAMTTRIESNSPNSTVAAAAEAAATKALVDAQGSDREMLIKYLLTRPNGLNILFQRINDRDDEYLSTLFTLLPSSAAATRARPTPLGAKEADLFVRLFPRLKGAGRQQWGEWLSIAGRPGASEKLFPTTGGPVDPSHAPQFLKFLSDDRTSLWVQSYFETVSPLPESEVGKIVPILRRGLKEFEGPPKPPKVMGMASGAGGGGSAPRRQYGISPGAAQAIQFRYAAVLRKRFPKHPDVAAFFKDFPQVLERVDPAVATNRDQRIGGGGRG